jgi:putative peptidoglycan lipid II flippase
MSNEDSVRAVSRSSFSYLAGTLLSRFSGLFRDIAMAFAFGSSPALAAFMVAFRLANLMRRLFGEGNLAAGFVPHFEEIRAVSPQQGARFFRDLFVSLALILCLVLGLVDLALFAFWKTALLNPDSAHILHLTLLMLPGILFICLFGLTSALLQCQKHYFLTGLAPLGFNLVWIVAALSLKKIPMMEASITLSLSIVLAFGLQLLMTVPHTLAFLKKQLTWRECFAVRLFSPELRRIVRPLLLGALGVGAVQINSALDALFARFAALEGPAYLWYAIRIEQLPLALFGIALSSALLPPLSRALEKGEQEHFCSLMRFALRRSYSLIMPCCMGLFVLGACGLNFLYGRGGFSQGATYQTLLCLWGYALGLLPAVFTLFFASAFYALKDYRTPMKGCLLSVGVNCALNALFVFGFGWGAFSIALSTSLSAFCNTLYLCSALKRRSGVAFYDMAVRRTFFQIGMITLLSALVVLFVGHVSSLDPTLSILLRREISFSRHFSEQLLEIATLGAAFVATFFTAAWLFKCDDALFFFRREGFSRAGSAREEN